MELPTKEQNPDGLYQRYYIQKIEGYRKIIDEWAEEAILVPVDPMAEYFIMRLDTGGSDPEHIKACRVGIHAYADAIEHHLPKLADDLRHRYPLL